ncbi:DUF6303 family protein [Streptomyces sp. NPDC020875]|uniref:DUF6303 family protein n=1 Tax=Streptomyces sp. NPDC020875 TaxID=3154898 RepID=UPI0033D85A18
MSHTPWGAWEVYIASDSPSKDWPVHEFGRKLPTHEERSAALAALGFAPVDGAVWEWTEAPGEDTRSIWLTGTLDVRLIGGGS